MDCGGLVRLNFEAGAAVWRRPTTRASRACTLLVHVEGAAVRLGR